MQRSLLWCVTISTHDEEPQAFPPSTYRCILLGNIRRHIPPGPGFSTSPRTSCTPLGSMQTCPCLDDHASTKHRISAAPKGHVLASRGRNCSRKARCRTMTVHAYRHDPQGFGPGVSYQTHAPYVLPRDVVQFQQWQCWNVHLINLYSVNSLRQFMLSRAGGNLPAALNLKFHFFSSAGSRAEC